MTENSLFEIVKKQVDKCDVYGLLASHCPADEFDHESALIARKLKKDMPANEIAEIIASVMSEQFGDSFKANDFIGAANAIKTAMDGCDD